MCIYHFVYVLCKYRILCVCIYVLACTVEPLYSGRFGTLILVLNREVPLYMQVHKYMHTKYGIYIIHEQNVMYMCVCICGLITYHYDQNRVGHHMQQLHW